MPDRKSITIVGGGLAGLTLGIGLRQQGIPVTLFEAGHYPRHRVCGEFINGLGLATLGRLHLIPLLQGVGAREARTVSFASAAVVSPARELPSPGLALSRYELDVTLAKRFCESGGELHENSRWRGDVQAEGTVLANGRRLQKSESSWQWFGLKVYARNVRLGADLEMHLLPHGYVGLCKLDNTTANVCGLFRRRVGSHAAERDWQNLLRGPAGSILRERLANSDFNSSSFCSVAGLGLRPQHASNSTECRIGDALTMTPPVTGNGMSMAFESAEMTIAPLTAYSRGELSWGDARRAMAKRCDAVFKRRLRWASAFHKLLFATPLQALFTVLPRVPFLWRGIVSRTR